MKRTAWRGSTTNRGNRLITCLVLWCVIGSGIVLPQSIGASSLIIPSFTEKSFGYREMTQSIVVGDLNGDNILDLVVGNTYESNTVYLNKGNATFAAPQYLKNLDPLGDATTSIALGDLNGDGALDIVAGNAGYSDTIHLNDGHGNFGVTHLLAPTNSLEDATTSIALGDLNGDGALDIVAGNFTSPHVVYLNKGDATFASPRLVDNSTGNNTNSIALGDLNDDGILDIVAGNSGGSNTIYFNQGDGSFSRPQPLEVSEGYGTNSIAVGDLNGDGTLDIVAGNYYESNMIYLNQGEGTFSPPQPLEDIGIDATTSIALGDLNGDGILDIIAGNAGGPSNINKIYLNKGEGTFALPEDLENTRGNNTNSIALGDLNDDGILDIVAGNSDGLNTIYLNNEQNTFGTYQTLGDVSTIDTSSIALGDLNGDGALDIIVGNSVGSNIVYLNQGEGTFSPPQPLEDTGIDATTSIALGDLNGDGTLDIVAGNYRGPNTIYLNGGEGSFAPAQSLRDIERKGDQTNSIAVGDLNGDGALDIVAGNAGTVHTVYLNDGQGTFAPAQPFARDDRNSAITLGDLNGDDALDIVAGNAGQPNTIYLNQGQGTFSPPQPLEDSERSWTNSITVGDLNGDGALDIVAGNTNQPDTIYLNDGQGSFGPAQPLERLSLRGSVTYGIALGDLNGDEELDIIAGSSNQPNTVYLNDGQGSFGPPQVLEDTDAYSTSSIAVGDFNGDGAPDIVAGNYGSPNMIYLNQGEGAFDPPQLLGDNESDWTSSIALGDLNGDGTLDIVAGNGNQDNMIYLNERNGTFSTPFYLNDTQDSGTSQIALGDLNGDGTLDIVAGNSTSPNTIYLNEGNGTFALPQPLQDTGGNQTESIALGDLNGDGTLDIIAQNYGNHFNIIYIYLNKGNATFASPQPLGYPGFDSGSIVLGDLNADGSLDILLGRFGLPNLMYLNKGNATFASPQPLQDSQGDYTTSIALGDINGDGALDIVAGNYRSPNTMYLNEGNATFASPQPLQDSQGDYTTSIALGDINGDGALDIVASKDGESNAIYLNEGNGQFRTPFFLNDTQRSGTSQIALGDLNSDGTLDIVAGNFDQPNTISLNNRVNHTRLPNNAPYVTVTRPGNTGNANFFSTAEIISETNVIDIPYSLFDREGDPVQAISATYSLDGGGQWYPAVADEAPGLDASPDGTDHVFRWNLLESGFFGASDNVVFRMVVYPAHNVPGPLLRPYASATTFPFRVRGTQVQVVQQDTNESITGAEVYRLPAGQTRNALPLAIHPDQPPAQTNAQGYLPGRSIIKPDDQLIALHPITGTETYTLYQTSAAVTEDGLDLTSVQEPGTQTLKVSPDNALLLFNLTVSLEWDVRQDQQYLLQLEDDLQRTSELLFDWSDGQIALGPVTVYQDREQWNDAHIRVYATNRMRPSANKGGIVDPGTMQPDPADATINYRTGQIRMGAVWNRYGDTDANLGEDWPRALAHELGHFALFLDDNYLGIKDGTLVSVATCPGAMSDPYLPDADEFHPRDAQWEAQCQQTLSEHTTGRSDWETIKTFYDQPELGTRLRAPVSFNARRGPAQLPLAVTQVTFADVAREDLPLDAPIFRITDQASARWTPSQNARAMLFQDNRLVDLGRPTRDQILARGTRSGDRLCVYDLDQQRLGCQTITANQRELRLTEHPNWQPDIRLTPVTSTTLQVEVQDASITGENRVWAQLYPATTTEISDTTASPPVQLKADGDRYVTRITIPPDQPTFEGHLHVWVNNQNRPTGPDGREAVVDYLLGGNPGLIWGRTAPRGNPGLIWGRTAPLLSSDGQAIVYGDDVDLQEGDFLTLQSAVRLPEPPVWANPVGRAYRLTATSESMLQGTSLNIGYQGDDVPDGEESHIQMYWWDAEAPTPGWTALDTQVDVDRNQASAQVVGPGVYVLMSSILTEIKGTAWQDISYLGQTQPVTTALAGIDGHYTTVYSYEPANTNDPWQVYDVDVPTWVNDLKQLEYGNTYWLWITKPVTLPVKGPRLQQTATTTTATSFPKPPATYYMTLPDMATGMPVVAWMDGQICGKTTTREVANTIGFVIDVVDTGTCNVRDRTVTFTVAGTTLPVTATWNNRRPQRLGVLIETTPQLYLPLVQR